MLLNIFTFVRILLRPPSILMVKDRWCQIVLSDLVVSSIKIKGSYCYGAESKTIMKITDLCLDSDYLYCQRKLGPYAYC